MADQQDAQPSNPPLRPGDRVDLLHSVAGEEDPGASIDLATPRGTEWNANAATGAARIDQAAGQVPGQPSAAQAQMAPGDEAPAGTPGTGEDVCPQCGGSGRIGGSACPNCQGTGKVTVGIGGA